MAGVRTYKITCDECGYSEEVPSARLTYEEGKTCPKCLKGKMYWVPPTEEARRREFWGRSGQGGRTMPAEERKISIAWAIPALLLLGVGGGTALVLALAREKEAPPEEGPPPGLANLYGKVTDAVTGDPISGVLVTLNGMQVYTDAEGNYAFTDLDPGTYSLFFQKGGYEEIEMADIILVEGDNVLNVPLTPIPPPVANLYGKVTDAQTGSPLAGVSVQLTDSGGHYSITNILPGNYLVYFIKEGYETEVR